MVKLKAKKTLAEQIAEEVAAEQRQQQARLEKQAQQQKRQARKQSQENWRPSSAEEDVKFFSIKKLIQVLVSRWLILLLTVLTVLIVCCLYFYFQNDKAAVAVLSLNYEQSTRGLTPNGTRFSISEVRSEEVARLAIQYAGMEGLIQPQDLIDCISVGTYTDRGYGSDDAYIATSFYIQLTSGYGENGVGDAGCAPSELLKMVVRAYKDVFFSSYTSSSIVFEEEPADYNSMEYLDIVSYLSKRLSRMGTFLSERVNEGVAFSSPEDGLTFQHLQEIQNNIRSLSFEAFRAYVWENGLAKNDVLTVATLEYQNSNLQKQYDQAMDEYQIRTDIIDEYENAMIDSVLIPTYDDMGEYYMSRTKTGIDELANEAESYLQQAKDYQVQIDQNSDIIRNIQSGSGQGSPARADQMVTSLDAQIKELEDMAVALNREYQSQLTHNYLSFQYPIPGFLSKLNVRVGAFLALAAGLVVLAAFYLEGRRADLTRQGLSESGRGRGGQN